MTEWPGFLGAYVAFWLAKQYMALVWCMCHTELAQFIALPHVLGGAIVCCIGQCGGKWYMFQASLFIDCKLFTYCVNYKTVLVFIDCKLKMVSTVRAAVSSTANAAN